MTAERENHPRVNPFSTRFVRPGAMPFLFGHGRAAAHLVRRLAELDGRGQIVGPHGSGKSTLVATLVEPLAQAKRQACVFALRDGQRRLPRGWVAQARDASAGTIVVDGYEQLSRGSRLWIDLLCRRNRWGLLVTTHEDVGLPTLVQLEPSLDVARAVVERLAPVDRWSTADDVVARCFDACDGNLREMLFALYDRYERQRVVRTDVA